MNTERMKARQAGVSVVEVLVGLTLGLILTLAMINYTSGQKQSYRIQDGLARLQENLGYANLVISRDVRMAGFAGCPKLSNITPNIVATGISDPVSYSVNSFVSGYEGNTNSFSPTLPTWLTQSLQATSGVRPGTDVIIVRKAGQRGSNLNSSMSSTSDAINTTNGIGFQSGQLLLISDCQSIDIFNATSATSATSIKHTQGSNTSGSLSKAYLTDAVVFPYEVKAFYIRDTGRLNRNNQTIYGLFSMDILGNEEEIAEGIENMQITYGVDTDNDTATETYQSANQVENANNWSKVRVVRINLLANTVDNAATAPQNYVFNGSTLTAQDLLLRRAWTTSIALRNMQ